MKGTIMNNKPTILLVDDDEDFIIQQKLALTDAGYQVLTASGRKEAETIADKEHLDCAVIDLMMEEMDGGFVLAHHLKSNCSTLPIILVTAVTSETGLDFGSVDSAEKKWVKADAILAKPIRFEQLDREIKRLIA
jgi:CheY-like chemotaxis protein